MLVPPKARGSDARPLGTGPLFPSCSDLLNRVTQRGEGFSRCCVDIVFLAQVETGGLLGANRKSDAQQPNLKDTLSWASLGAGIGEECVLSVLEESTVDSFTLDFMTRKQSLPCCRRPSHMLQTGCLHRGKSPKLFQMV